MKGEQRHNKSRFGPDKRSSSYRGKDSILAVSLSKTYRGYVVVHDIIYDPVFDRSNISEYLKYTKTIFIKKFLCQLAFYHNPNFLVERIFLSTKNLTNPYHTSTCSSMHVHHSSFHREVLDLGDLGNLDHIDLVQVQN